MDNHFFRSALNGFNRQDVLNFLTSSAEKNNEERSLKQ